MLKGDVVDQYAEEFVPLLKQSHVKVCREEPRPCFYNGERMNALAILRRVFPDVAATAEPLFVALLPDRDAHLMAEILHWQLLERVREAAPALHVFGHCHGLQGGRRLSGPAGEEGTLFVNAASSDGCGGIAPPVVVDVRAAARL